jgi:hypothetical protein
LVTGLFKFRQLEEWRKRQGRPRAEWLAVWAGLTERWFWLTFLFFIFFF